MGVHVGWVVVIRWWIECCQGLRHSSSLDGKASSAEKSSPRSFSVFHFVKVLLHTRVWS